MTGVPPRSTPRRRWHQPIREALPFLLLLVLTPAQVLGRLPALSSPWLLGIALLAGSAVLLASRPRPRRWLAARWQHWRHHLPSGDLARSMLPAACSSTQAAASITLRRIRSTGFSQVSPRGSA